MSEKNRLDVLDGMRGMAAIAVVLYHYLARWTEPAHGRTLYPHGDWSNLLPGLGSYGYFGVFLFFMISGFVIMMTLERSTGIADFASRRALRLWPTMIVCATFSSFIVNRSGMGDYYGMDMWKVEFLEYLSSIVFLPPDLLYKYLDAPERGHWVEGVYWTLWSEVRFYALVAAIYFVARRGFDWSWLAIQCVAMAIVLADLTPGRLFYPILLLQPSTLPWFTLGICGYRYWQGRMTISTQLVIVPALVSLLAHQEGSFRMLLLSMTVCGVFLLFLMRSPLLAPLRWRPLLVLGMSSYPLYLFHEMPGMAGFMLGEQLGLPFALSMAVVIAAVIIAALGIHYLIEEPIKYKFSRPLRRISTRIEERFPFLKFA